MHKDDSIYIEHIFNCLERILLYIKNIQEESFSEDYKTQDAVIRQLEIIGEAAKKISDIFKDKYPDIPWKDLSGMRNKLIHDYIDVDISIVWKTASEDVPVLLKIFKEIR
jgi:uncharacterized protein with HEPN domain